ncbi:uncharacterized protein B0H64DRAFT_203005 [Chaetomium fimeti]|uniref:Transcription factor domain-containing protein n=1 Tax=Chaetomium fimeti TaxID=1854472 RepID=A0AAE0LPN6_9PEZI|nr:hypothetical protein B0H64DRAFT_203005 [Chaetomium fimeti]
MAATGPVKPGGGHIVKFVGHDAIGLPVKRKQVHQACLPCRKRKKRCRHVEDSITDTLPTDDPDQEPSHGVTINGGERRSKVQRHTAATDRDTSDAAAQLLRFFHHASDTAASSSPEEDQTQQPRPMSPAPPFLGDLNPEGILIEATMAPSRKPPPADEDPEHQVLGFLPPTSPRGPTSRGPPTRRHSTACTGSPQLVEEASGPFFSVPREDGTSLTIHVQDTAKFAAIAQTLVNRGLADKVMPSDTEWRALRDVYLLKIQPIFPIYETSCVVDLPKETGLRELIQGSICLAAATDPDARSLLTFKSFAQGSKTQRVVSFDEYSREMASFINKRLVELQESRQIPLTDQIQVMALTCFYWQPASPTERFEPLTLYAKLVSMVHTHGVHQGILASAAAEGSVEGRGRRLFKCLYALDRLVGAISARPLMFHNVDLIQVPRPHPEDSPIFRLFISLILVLDQVIEMYRPRPKFSCVDIPVFERMAIEAGAQCEPEILLVTLEVLYHAIGVLSVRMPRHRFRTAPECDTPQGPPTQHLPPSGMNARRSHSSDRILDIIKDYKLSPMPFVPYAITLSLSVAYRKWRFSQLPVFRTRGGADFKKVLPVVQELGAIWSSARINGQLGQAVMLKLDRSEILKRNRKRAKKTAEASGAKGGRNGELRGAEDQEASTGGLGGVRGEDVTQPPVANPAPTPSSSTTPPGAPSSPVMSPEPSQTTQAQGAPNITLGPSTSLRAPLPSPAASCLTERQQPQSLPLTWTTAWTADNHNSNLPTGQPCSAPPNDNIPRPNTTQQPEVPLIHHCNQPDDPIPLPGDLLTQSGPHDTPPLAGLSDGSLEDFLVDDDALFRSWDPRFAQSVDCSFSSILDPGNPFAWPEYCNYE